MKYWYWHVPKQDTLFVCLSAGVTLKAVFAVAVLNNVPHVKTKLVIV